jgi:hypothetical protein
LLISKATFSFPAEIRDDTLTYATGMDVNTYECAMRETKSQAFLRGI